MNNILKKLLCAVLTLFTVVSVLGVGRTAYAKDAETEDVSEEEIIYEKENNNKKSKANEIALGGSITGRLSSEKDVDWYKFKALGDGKLLFEFTPETSSVYAYCWYATVYDSDGKKVLKEGALSGKEASKFSISDVKENTYYLKISRISGGNPLTNGFSKDNYSISVSFECTSHAALLPWEITTAAGCASEGERVQKCSLCGKAVVNEVIPKLSHEFNEWSITKEASMFNIGEKKHSCVLCGKVLTEAYLATSTIILLIACGVLVLALIIFAIIKKVREEKSYSSSYRSSYSGSSSSYSGSSSSSSSSYGSSSTYSGSSSYDYSSSGSSYDDDLPTSVYNSQYTNVGGIDYAVHTTDAEGYSTGSYYEDAEGYKHSTDGLDVSEPFNWLDS